MRWISGRGHELTKSWFTANQRLKFEAPKVSHTVETERHKSQEQEVGYNTRSRS